MTWYELGMPMCRDEEILEAAELIRHLYEDLRQSTGGPLHVVLDDGNIGDDTIEYYLRPDKQQELYGYLWDGSFGKWAQAGDDTSDELKRDIEQTCKRIIELFNEWPEGYRAAAIAWWDGSAERQLKRLATELAPPEVISEEWREHVARTQRALDKRIEQAYKLEADIKKLRDENHRLRSIVDAELKGVTVDLCLCGKQGHQHEGAPLAFCIWCCPQCNAFQPKVTS